ncbi:MAG TPA: hypothetical protein VN802_00715 [Stellaceae bacterium]|nr:hypothetical protein [Stellaceae bacterium]
MIETTDQLFPALRQLIDAWCDRRALRALSRVLGAYLVFAGLTDSWGELRRALHEARVFARAELLPDELETIGAMIATIDQALARAPKPG